MGMPSVEGLCRYGLIESGHDETARLCLAAAEQYYADSGVPESAHDNPQYELAVYMLALHYYDHRGAITDAHAELPHGVMAMVHHLRY